MYTREAFASATIVCRSATPSGYCAMSAGLFFTSSSASTMPMSAAAMSAYQPACHAPPAASMAALTIFGARMEPAPPMTMTMVMALPRLVMNQLPATVWVESCPKAMEPMDMSTPKNRM